MTIEERLQRYLGQKPKIHESAYIASGAVVIGAVTLGEHASIWHNAVVRADINTIKVGQGDLIKGNNVLTVPVISVEGALIMPSVAGSRLATRAMRVVIFVI